MKMKKVLENQGLFLAEGVKRKLNAGSPALDNLELVEFDPPKQLSNRLYPFDNTGASLTKVEPRLSKLYLDTGGRFA